jgi:hypothetical protein
MQRSQKLSKAYPWIVSLMLIKPVTQVPAVLSQWRAPAHEEFTVDGKTAWRLFNAFSETWKGRNLTALPRKPNPIGHAMLAIGGQTCSPISVAFDDQAVAEFFDQEVDKGRWHE